MDCLAEMIRHEVDSGVWNDSFYIEEKAAIYMLVLITHKAPYNKEWHTAAEVVNIIERWTTIRLLVPLRYELLLSKIA